MSRLLLLVVCFAGLAGCQDRFRYACQDSANWEKEFCQKPKCVVTQTCPEHVMKIDDMKGEVR
jgi:hypothetical protein